MPRGRAPAFVPTTMFLDPDLVLFLDAAANKLRQGGRSDMSKDRLASILCYIGASSQCFKEGADEMGHELIQRANALADGCKLPTG